MSNINKDMTFAELLRANPGAGAVLSKHGLHCLGCHMATSETVEQGCRAHGIDDASINSIIKELGGE